MSVSFYAKNLSSQQKGKPLEDKDCVYYILAFTHKSTQYVEFQVLIINNHLLKESSRIQISLLALDLRAAAFLILNSSSQGFAEC